MRQRYLGSSITVISPIDVLTDNTNRLYNNSGTLYFNGTAVGAGAADNNAWVNANDYSTYTTLSALVDTVQDNVTALPDSAANDYSTYTTVVSLIDTVQDNVATNESSINTVSSNAEPASITIIESGGVFVVDGTSQQAVVLSPSITYRFDQSDSTNSTHPIRLSTTSDGTHGGGVAFTTGVTEVGVPGNAGAYTEVTLEQDAPTALYYYCGNHSGMGGSISLGGGSSTWAETGDDIYYDTGAVTIGPGPSYTPASNLYVYGNTYVTGNVEVGDTLIELSSQAIKTNIVPLRHQLSKIQLLNPVEYDKIRTNNHELGLIAEEVSSILPHVVAEGNTAISYTRIVPVLIQALKELKEEVDTLKRNLDGRI